MRIETSGSVALPIAPIAFNRWNGYRILGCGGVAIINANILVRYRVILGLMVWVTATLYGLLWNL